MALPVQLTLPYNTCLIKIMFGCTWQKTKNKSDINYKKLTPPPLAIWLVHFSNYPKSEFFLLPSLFVYPVASASLAKMAAEVQLSDPHFGPQEGRRNKESLALPLIVSSKKFHLGTSILGFMELYHMATFAVKEIGKGSHSSWWPYVQWCIRSPATKEMGLKEIGGN